MSTLAGNSLSAPRATSAIRWGRVSLVGLATVLAANIATVIVFFIGDAIVGYDPEFLVLDGPGPTITFTVFFSILAVLVYALVLRFSRNPVRHYTIIAAVALVLSIVPDLTYIPTVEGSSNGQVAVLVIMHIVAAAVIVAMLTRLAGPSKH